MVKVNDIPSWEELQELIDSVESYPITAWQLSQLATAEGSGRRVIEFYRSFPHDQVFSNKDDLINRSEQIHIMSEEELEQPWEDELTLTRED